MNNQNLPEHIDFDELRTLKIIGHREVLEKCYRYFQKYSEQLDIKFTDILEVFGLNNNIPKDIVSKFQDFQKLSDEKKQEFLSNDFDDSVKIIKNILQEKKESHERLEGFQIRLVKFWLDSHIDGKPGEEVLEMIEILSLATGKSPDVIDKTDYMVLSEIFIRIFIKPKQALNNAFFLNLFLKILKTFMPSLNSTINELLKK